ncbi:hypothetical protein B0H11DRAFT_1903871 [Mycena galericulata]|nr:hypothetical protein B0H11DRAFT_1903871 [Mycena galericulata]
MWMANTTSLVTARSRQIPPWWPFRRRVSRRVSEPPGWATRSTRKRKSDLISDVKLSDSDVPVKPAKKKPEPKAKQKESSDVEFIEEERLKPLIKKIKPGPKPKPKPKPSQNQNQRGHGESAAACHRLAQHKFRLPQSADAAACHTAAVTCKELPHTLRQSYAWFG